MSQDVSTFFFFGEGNEESGFGSLRWSFDLVLLGWLCTKYDADIMVYFDGGKTYPARIFLLNK